MGDVGDFLFGETEELKPRDIRSPTQQRVFEGVTGAAGDQAINFLQTAGDPFPSNLVDPTALTSLQQSLFDRIPGLVNRPDFTSSDLFQQAQGAITGALEGFDPFKDLRFQALRTNLERELKRAKDRIAARSSGKEEFFGGGRLDQEREQEEFAFGQLANIAGRLEEQSRLQQLQAVGPAVNLASLRQNAPFDFLQQSLGFADIPRSFDEATRVARLNELNRQRAEQAGTVGPALQTSMFSPPLAFDVFSSTPGLLGGPSGVGFQPGGGVNRNVQIASAGLGGFTGGAGGGGIGGAIGGAAGLQGGGQNQQIVQLLQQLLGGQGGIGGQGFGSN